jgi:hypothetical protein
MSTDKKISNLIEQQFPFFVRDEGPNLVAFLKAYYEWTEQANNAIEVSKNLLNYQDIDATYNKYLNYFDKEILQSIPKSILADRKKLAKHIKDIYRARGSELSYRLLFRVLFNEEIDFYYPGEDILRASDGRWIKETTIRVSIPRTATLTQFLGQSVTGLTSGASARVDKINTVFSGGVLVDELYLLDIDGTFQDYERVALTSNNSIYATISASVGPLQGVSVFNGGALHQTGDAISFASASGTGANGVVTAISDTSAVKWNIADGGSGYTANATITITGGSGVGAAFTIASIANTEIIAINTDTIAPVANVVLNTGPTFVSLGANTAAVSANLAIANISTPLNALAFSNVTVGTISALTVTNYGYGYLSLPSATVIQENISDLEISDGSGGIKGRNASITPENASGAITAVNVTNFGSNYSRTDNVTITNLTRAGTAAAQGTPEVSGMVFYPGRYVDTKGWLSWNNKLQDNLYYQEFSYEIRSTKVTNAYRQLVNAIVHPAGTKMFGRISLFSDVQTTVVTVDSQGIPTGTEAPAQSKLNIESEISIDLPTIISDFGTLEISPGPILEYTANTTVVTTATTLTVYATGTGSLFTSNATTINAYSTEIINTYALLPVGDLGSPKLLVGNNTLFTVEIPTSNTGLWIIDTYGGTANGLYFTNATYSNTFATLKLPYPNLSLSNGSFYYIANTS